MLLSLITIVILLQFVLSSVGALPSISGAAGIALMWLAARWIREYTRPSTSPLWDCADGTALLLVTLAIENPFSGLGMLHLCVLYSSLSFRSLSLSGKRVTITVLVYFNVFLAGVIVTSVLDIGSGSAAAGFGHLPGLALIGGAGYLLAQTLARRDDESLRRDAFLTASGYLRTASSIEDVLVRLRAGATGLLGEHPVTTVRTARVEAGSVSVIDARGEDNASGEEHLRELRLALEAEIPALRCGHIVHVSGVADRVIAKTLDAIASTLTIVPVVAKDHLYGMIVLVGPSTLPGVVMADVERLADQSASLIERISEANVLREREAAYRSLVENSSDAIAVVSEEFSIEFVTPVAANLFRRSPSDLVGTPLTNLVHPDDLSKVITYLEQLQDGLSDVPAVDWRCQDGDGSWIAVETRGSNLVDNPHIQGLLLTNRDVSDRKALESRLVHQAFHDPLTDLGNRALFLEQLRSELARPLRRSVSHAVMFLDLDRFKLINDTLGHEAGDQLLMTVAERIRDCVRTNDLVARLGGDEFAILLHDIIDEVPAVQVAERILRAMDDPIYVAGHRLFVTTSIGIALGSALRDLPDELIRRADVAMYEAKRMGKACYAVYDRGIDQHKVERLDLESDLRSAIRSRQIEVYYQPLISLESGKIQQLEALVRWRHPERGLLPPSEFIGMAEETGLILPIGRHVLRESCKQVAEWKSQPAANSLQLAVNLSARQFQQPGLVEDVAKALAEANLPPGDLTIEITESVAMIDIDASIALLRDLKQIGVQIAIDDFGIGYSALNTLKYFPVDSLKIDRSFIQGLGADRGDMAIVGAVIACARALDLGVIAEGIETVQQIRTLRTLDCDQGQGYLISAPLSGRDVPSMLTRSSSPSSTRGSAQVSGTSIDGMELISVHVA